MASAVAVHQVLYADVFGRKKLSYVYQRRTSFATGQMYEENTVIIEYVDKGGQK